MALVEIKECPQALRRPGGPEGRLAERGCGRGGLSSGRQRQRQDHLAALYQPSGDHRRWRDQGRGRTGRLCPGPDGKLREEKDRITSAKRARIGMVFQRFNLFAHLTVLENVTEAPIQVLGAAPDAGAQRRAGASRQCRPQGQGRALSARAFRRPAAARRHRPGPGDGAAPDAVRRADLGARSRTGRRSAGNHAPPRRRRHDHDRGHP